MKNSNGFSLLETIVVMAILAILSSIAVPSLISQRNNANIRDAVSMIRGDFEMAKSRAIRENAFVSVKIDTDGYMIFIDNGIDNGSGVVVVAGNTEHNVDERILCTRKFPAGIQIDFAQTTFTANNAKRPRFNGRGYSTNNGILTLVGLNGKSATVDMNNRFGRITTH